MITRIFITLCFIFLSLNCFSQIEYNRNVYLMGPLLGAGFQLNKSATDKSLNIDCPYIVKGSIFAKIKNNFGVHLSIQGIEYRYNINNDFIRSENSGFYLLGEHIDYDNYKQTLFIGVSYKISYQRLIVMPFIDIGIISYTQSSMDAYSLKEHGSNNILSMTNQLNTNVSRFDYAFGADLCFHFTKLWGLAASIQFDRFRATSYIQSLGEDSFSRDEVRLYEIKFNNFSIFGSLSIFLAF